MGVSSQPTRTCVSLCRCRCRCPTHTLTHTSSEWVSVWMWMCVCVKRRNFFPNGKLCWWNNNEWNDILGAFTICACSIKVYSIAWRPLNRWWRKISFRLWFCVCVCVRAYWCISVWKFVYIRSLSMYILCVSVCKCEWATDECDVVCCECDASVLCIAHNITKMF